MTALERAISYLSVKPRTRSQVAAYLKDKGFSEDETADTIARLEEYRYIDDMEYARMYTESGFAKGHGESRIRRELAGKGVDSNTVDDVFYEFENEGMIPNQFQMALEVGRSVLGDLKLNDMEYEERRKMEGRIGRRLISRGFETSVVYSVIRELEE